MRKKVLWGGLLPGLILLLGSNLGSQENGSDIRVVVNMVQLNVAVTDNKGNYITNLRPSDFAIAEDGITQKLATFGEEGLVVQELRPVAEALVLHLQARDEGMVGIHLEDRREVGHLLARGLEDAREVAAHVLLVGHEA